MDEESKKEAEIMKKAWEILDKQQELQKTSDKVTHETLAEAMQAHLYLIEQAMIISKKFNKYNIHIKLEDENEEEEGGAYYSAIARIGREAAEELLTALIPDMKELQPYLQKELNAPKYEGKSIYALYAIAEQDPEKEVLPDRNSLFMQAIKAARQKRRLDKLKEPRRTSEKAGEVDQITVERIAIPTLANFANAVTLNENGSAYMRQIKMDGLTFENGMLYFENEAAHAISEAKLQDLKTKENIQSINLPFLQFYYSHLYGKWEADIQKHSEGKPGGINPVTTFYFPDLAKARGLAPNAGKDSLEAMKKDIASFHNIVGVIKVEGHATPSYFPVLTFQGYDAEKNTISISSPYLLHVVRTVYNAAIRRDKKGAPRLKGNGTPELKAANSHLVDLSILKERDKIAVQNVFLIVQGIERCDPGKVYKEDGVEKRRPAYTISAQTIIERNPQFEEQLETNQNKREVLKRRFKKTWELLRSKTHLLEKYPDMVLPDPENPASIPRPSDNLGKFIFKFGPPEKQ